ncbi:hypothetical protein LH646_01085 [Streptomyces sp. WA1-19]|uniref:hypothetical protein n=1 Tax=Streptomyces sp. WA1-19 TaxID=2884220 RepID=UPI001A49DC2F|nr:hypothetical protein [Streptomyces sp. WA1-19]MBL0776439.1 hypothetical protein [Streptomyces albidoflavus]UDF06242.1 hypothetical protein LH646_01085 [Streptomyces sp. WA1-19]
MYEESREFPAALAGGFDYDDGYGVEAAAGHGAEGGARPDAAREAVAERFAPGRRRGPVEVVAAARAGFPGFDGHVRSLTR